MKLHRAVILIILLATIFVPTAGAEVPERTLDRARTAVESKDYDQAIGHYRKIAEWMKRDPGLLVEWARVYTYADRHQEAVDLFERISRDYPDRRKGVAKELAEQRAYLALNAARALVKRRDYPAALKEYAKISLLQERDTGLIVENARVYAYANMHEEAIALFEKALGEAKGPETAKVSNELANQRAYVKLATARELVEQKNYNAAAKLYEELGDWLSRDVNLLVEQGRVYAYANRHQQAISLFETALKDSKVKDAAKVKADLADQRAYVKLGQARALVADKKYAAAIKVYDELAGWMKRDPGLLVERARVYAYASKNKEAKALLEQALAMGGIDKEAVSLELADQNAYLALNRARSLVEKKDYRRALEEYAKIGVLEKRDANLVVEHARVYAYARMHDRAIELFEQALKTGKVRDADRVKAELADQRAFVTLAQARRLVEKKDYNAAIKLYDGLAGWLKRDAGLVVERARVYAYANRNQEAETLLREALATDGVDRNAISLELEDQRAFIKLNRARLHVREGNHEQALLLYQELSDWLERDTGLMIERARVYTYANRHTEALELFEKAVKKQPDLKDSLAQEMANQRAYLVLEEARALVEREDYNGALERYDTIEDLLATDPGLIIEKARVYSYARRNLEAAALFKTVLAKHPDYAPEFLRQLGNVYTWEKQFDSALEAYRRAIKLNPSDVRAQIAMARTLSWKGDIKEAFEAIDSILADDPDNVPALIVKADTYTKADRLGKATETINRALELEPGNLDALNLQAKIMVWQGYHRKGQARYRDILDLDPENLEALDGLAHALYWDGRSVQALVVLEQLLALSPSRMAARRLMYRIRTATRPYAGATASWSEDSHPRTVVSYGVHGGFLPASWLKLEAGYLWSNLEEEEDEGDFDTDINTVNLGLEADLLSTFLFDASINRHEYLFNDWDTYSSDIDLKWVPLNTIRLTANYSWNVVNSLEALANETHYYGLEGSVTWKPNRLWKATAKADVMDFSDGNQRQHLFGSLSYRFRQHPYTKIYYNYYDLEYRNDGDGYFSPEDFLSHTLGLYASHRMTRKWFVAGQGSMGREYHQENEWVPSYYWAGEITYRPTYKWSIALKGSRFVSDDDVDLGLEGYDKLQFSLMISRALGGEEWVDERAPQPSVPGVLIPIER